MPKPVSLPGNLSDYIVKFCTYHLYYKEKLGMTKSAYNSWLFYRNELVSNPTQTFVCAVSSLYFRYCLDSFGNLSMASSFACNKGAYATQPNLISKKRKLLKTVLQFSYPFQPLFLFFSLIFMSKSQFSSALTDFLWLADYQSVKLISGKTIKSALTITKNCEYLISPQNMPKVLFHLFYVLWIV